MKKKSAVQFLFVSITLMIFQCGYAQQQTAPVKPLKEKYNESKPVEDEIGYTHAVKVGNRLYISGTVATGDMPAQIKDIMESLQRTLAKYHAGFENIVKENVFTTDLEAFKKNRAIRNQYYKGDYPAATWVEVKQLYLPQYKVEIEVEAFVSN